MVQDGDSLRLGEAGGLGSITGQFVVETREQTSHWLSLGKPLGGGPGSAGAQDVKA